MRILDETGCLGEVGRWHIHWAGWRKDEKHRPIGQVFYLDHESPRDEKTHRMQDHGEGTAGWLFDRARGSAGKNVDGVGSSFEGMRNRGVIRHATIDELSSL